MIKLNKKDVVLAFVFLVVVSGVTGILREVFFKPYEEEYHFLLTMGSAAVYIPLTFLFMLYLSRKKN